MSCIIDSPTVDLSISGSSLRADAKVSPDGQNILQARSNGLYVPGGVLPVALELIEESIVSGIATAMIDWGSIPQNFENLIVEWKAQTITSSGTGTDQFLAQRFNANASGDYLYVAETAFAGSVTAGGGSTASYAPSGVLVGSNDNVNSEACGVIRIPRYASSVRRVMWSWECIVASLAGPTAYRYAGGGMHQTLSGPVTRIQLYNDAGHNFSAQSLFRLYGEG